MNKLFGAANRIRHLEQFAQKDTSLHRMHPFAKMLLTLCYGIVVISFPNGNLSGLAIFLCYPILAMALAEIPYKVLLPRLALALPFSLLGGLSNLILNRQVVFTVGILPVTEGLLSFCSILLKTLMTVFMVLLLIGTTTLEEINGQLARLKVPKIFCLQLVMTYRYLSVLLEEVSTLYTAYMLRAGEGQKGLQMKDMGTFLGQLILRSFDRANQVYQAMQCRGFQGVYPSSARERACISSWVVTLLICGSMIGLRFFNFNAFLGGLR